MQKILNQLLDKSGSQLLINADMVVNAESGQTASGHMADSSIHLNSEAVSESIGAAINLLKDNGDGTALSADMDSLLKISTALGQLKESLENFLTGEGDGGNIDRLTELVTAIAANKDTIDSLLIDTLKASDLVDSLGSSDTTKALTAAQGKVLKDALDIVTAAAHAHSNESLLDGLSSAASGNLVHNGKELFGCGVGIVSDLSETPAFDDKLTLVVTEYTPPA